MIEITVYSWKDAPPVFKRLSDHGGDEDWVAVSETRLTEYEQWCYLPRTEHLQEVEGTNGDMWVYIGAHA